MLVTVTKLGWRSPEALDEVLLLTGQVLDQLATTTGLLGGRLLLEDAAAWTLTAWADVAAVRAFGAAHAPVAEQGPRLADVLLLTSWRSDDDALPGWDEVRGRWPHGEGPGEGASVDLPAAVGVGV